MAMSIFKYVKELPKIPSEFIAPYCEQFMIYQLECLAITNKDVNEVKQDLKGVRSFIGAFGGIHVNLAIYNEYSKLMEMENKELKQFAINFHQFRLSELKKTIVTHRIQKE